MADKKLKEVRAQFVGGINKAIISQLVDDLLEKGVLNEEEGDEVKENPKKQDQARILIDHVRRKGPKASQIFLEVLQCRDSFLAEELSLSAYLSGGPVCPSQCPSSLPVEETRPLESRNGVTLCPPKLFQEIQGKEAKEIYRIEDPNTRTRLALIICNIEFAHHSRRDGAEVDLHQMTLLLEDLGYKVEPQTNLTVQEMANSLKCFAAREEHKTSDSTFLVLMSHGIREGLCGVESQTSDVLSVDTIISSINNQNCPALLGKPKVVIIQACRGDKKGFAYVSDSSTPPAPSLSSASSWSHERYEQDAVQKVHIESDFICFYSTTPDNVSWRSPLTGSLFIVQLIKQIKEHAWNCDLEEVFRKVLQSFEKNPLQMPSKDRTTLVKKFYLFPGY